MKSGQRILAVLAGAAMLAMPMTAAAAGFHRNATNYSRPSGHASGPRTFAAPRSFSAPRAFNYAPARPAPARAAAFTGFRAPRTAATFRSFNRVTTPPVPMRPAFAPVTPTVWNRQAVAAQPIAPYYGNYNNGYGAPAIVPVGHHHHEPDADDYYGGNGYYGAGAPGVQCDADGDDCVPAGYYQGSYYGPSSYYFNQAPGETGPAYLQHLMYARQMAWIKYQNALARGDRKGAKHLYNAYTSLNNSIARVRGRVGYGYATGPVPAIAPPVAYAPPAAYAPPVAASPLGSLFGGGAYAQPVAPSPLTSLFGGGAGYSNYGYNPALGSNPAYANYGRSSYGNNPYAYGNANPYGYGGNGLTTTLGPLLQQFIP
jgi:hypothetical protein